MSQPTMGDLLGRIKGSLDSAAPRLRLRAEWKTLEGFYRAHSHSAPSSPVDEDLLRAAEAELDLLELARAEVNQSLATEEREKDERLVEDERILGRIQEEARTYSFLIVVSFVLPPILLLLPFGLLLLVGLVPVLLGFARMRRQEAEAEGRVWLVLRSRVDEVLARIRSLHYVAVGSLLLTGLWTVVEMLTGA